MRPAHTSAFFGMSKQKTPGRVMRAEERISQEMVPGTGLEPAHLAVHGPKPCASANSAIRASCFIVTLQAEDS